VKSRTSTVALAGWIFADMLLALVLLFAGVNVSVPPRPTPSLTPTPTPTRTASPTPTAAPPQDIISLTSICRVVRLDGGPLFFASSISRAAAVAALRSELADLGGNTAVRAKLVLTFGVARDPAAAERLSLYVNELLKAAEVRDSLGNLLREGDALQTRDYIRIDGNPANEGQVRIELFVASLPGGPAPLSRPDCGM
jgi:hypothetical protein